MVGDRVSRVVGREPALPPASRPDLAVLRTPVVEMSGVVKRLGRVVALDGLDLQVDQGQVTALVGPNGAGKSVALRVLLGLVRPAEGRVRLFGEPVRPGMAALGRVGSLIDGPGFVPHLTGRQNLRLAERLSGRRATGLEPALRTAGLGSAIDRPYSTYSHGMRYRLGLGAALLNNPDLLVLDEPATGLDPLQVRLLREVIAEASARGTTVLLSSHHLADIEQMCTHVAVVQRGKLVAAGTVADLTGPAQSIFLRVDDQAGAQAVLERMPDVWHVTSHDEGLRVAGDRLRPAALLAALDWAGLRTDSFHRGRTLDEAYADLLDGAGPHVSSSS
jgi:ABC-2 type transport system ATP-binding protein